MIDKDLVKTRTTVDYVVPVSINEGNVRWFKKRRELAKFVSEKMDVAERDAYNQIRYSDGCFVFQLHTVVSDSKNFWPRT